MARKQAAEPESGRDWKTIFRYIFAAFLVFGLAIAALFAFSKFEDFVTTDQRFVLPGPPAFDTESPNLTLSGIRHASRERVLALFTQDFGRSLYLFPVAERRRNLLTVNWVKDASVLRIWPNRVAVQIVERSPVAFAQLVSGRQELIRFALIDEDGYLLDPPARAKFDLPVLVGIQPADTRAIRRDRVQRLTRLMRDVGEVGDRISEVDASDLDNLKVSVQAEGRSLTLMLGNQRFQQRIQNFLNHYDEVSKGLTGAATLDLRLEDRITVVQGAGRAE